VNGYELLGHFPVAEEVWWEEYYGPLEDRIQALQVLYKEEREACEFLQREQQEVDLYKKYSDWYGSAFFLMRKSD
jgi:hypothetical protein